MIHSVVISNSARKAIKRIPPHVVMKLLAWVEAVEHDGLEWVRKIPGFHDEPLKGVRQGQRSIRLTRSYRAIYRVVRDFVEFVVVEEVSKHDY